MLLIILGLIALLLTFGPQLWVRYTLNRHGRERSDLPGTGGEFAQHLIDRFHIDASVQMGASGQDHYDPSLRIISLSPEHYDGRSVSAVAVAAHEIGHAIQHQQEHPGFMKRQQRMLLALTIERFSAIALVISPIILVLIRVPQSSLLTLLIGASGLLASIGMQLINLPIERDASFNKAMPILAQGYLVGSDLEAAHTVLKAAAYTYVAAALQSLLNVPRWISILRR